MSLIADVITVDSRSYGGVVRGYMPYSTHMSCPGRRPWPSTFLHSEDPVYDWFSVTMSSVKSPDKFELHGAGSNNAVESTPKKVNKDINFFCNRLTKTVLEC
ncbi:hypothetical protein J6590_044593 [Homalodisca vitripennis]|nr:hypothetical protein J6590_044593 [Homalodisca vitripennis]